MRLEELTAGIREAGRPRAGDDEGDARDSDAEESCLAAGRDDALSDVPWGPRSVCLDRTEHALEGRSVLVKMNSSEETIAL